MPRPQSEAPCLHLERARDREGSSRTAWCADYWRGECPARGWWWRKLQKSNKPSKLPEIYENGEKTGGFTHFLAYKLPKILFFYQQYLTRYIPKTFFEEYINFKMFHYLSHCGVIPVQSLGSHIRPHLPRLGLNHSWKEKKSASVIFGEQGRCEIVLMSFTTRDSWKEVMVCTQ